MNPSAIQLAAPRTRIRPSAHTAPTLTIATSRRRTDVAAHRYSLPVVRELPMPLADRAGDRSW